VLLSSNLFFIKTIGRVQQPHRKFDLILVDQHADLLSGSKQFIAMLDPSKPVPERDEGVIGDVPDG
jgi:hypothetical protein